MIVLGILSVLQMLFLPGSLVLRLLSTPEKTSAFHDHRSAQAGTPGWIPAIAYTIGLSLIINYCVVFLLAALHQYTRPVLGALVGIELVAWIWAFRAMLLRPLGKTAGMIWSQAASWISSFVPDFAGADEGRTIARLLSGLTTIVFAGLALSAILWAVTICINNIGSVFNSWDAIFSWNRWAAEWSTNRLPTNTALYPQLLPTNWSLSYVLIGTSQVQFFAKAVAPLFLLLILLLLFDLGLDYRLAGFFLAVELTRLMTKKFAGEFIAEGYADIPVAFMALLALHPLLKKQDRTSLLPVLLGLVFAGGAAITKQAGLLVLVVYPFLAFFVLRGEVLDFQPRREWKKFLTALVLALLVAAPWYIYKQLAIQAGFDTSNAGVLVDIFGGKGPLERFLLAMAMLERYAYLVALLVPALFWLPRRIRWVTVLVTLPYTLVWAFLFSYDTRNFMMAVPLAGLAGGVALGSLLDGLYGLAGRLQLRRLPAAALLVLVAAALGALAYLLPSTTLTARQAGLQKQTFSPQLNHKLYDYIETHAGENVRILTNYPVAYLPGLEENEVTFWYKDFAAYDTMRQKKQFNALLVPFYAAPDIMADIDQRLTSGEYELVFEDNHYLAYRLIRVR